MSSNFMDIFRHSVKREAIDDDNEELPTMLNTINITSGFVVVSPDKFSVKYVGNSDHVCVVQANKPAPSKRFTYYFEIHVKDAGVNGRISIGFTTENHKFDSCGYHGDDGFIYLGKGQKGEAFGPTYTTGDTVGCGINYDSHEFFFTLNGNLVGTIFKYIKDPLYPTVSVHSRNEEITLNFGQEKFAFDLKGYEASERNKQQIVVTEKTYVPANMVHRFIKSYLLHYGYEETLHAFHRETKSTVHQPIYIAQENGVDVDILDERKMIREHIRMGEIDAVFAKLRVSFPQVLENDKSEVCRLLHCQKFIELVRVGAVEEALKYSSLELAKFIRLTVYKNLIEDIFSLLMYKRPQESSVGYFLEQSQREVVADAVNEAILSITIDAVNGERRSG